MPVNILFLGNCQMSKYRQFYNDTNVGGRSSRFDSITPYFGKYDEEETLRAVESADLVVSQLVTSDVTFSRQNILNMRANKDTIFTPYFYLTGFRRMEKLASKGDSRVDGSQYFTDALTEYGEVQARVKYLSGDIKTENDVRLNASLTEMERREELGADVKLADYVRQTYREKLPSYSINHPAPHVLIHAYNQIAALAGFPNVCLETMTDFQIGRATLPNGTGSLSPYCVETLGLDYAHSTHWFGDLNKICNYLTVQNRMDN